MTALRRQRTSRHHSALVNDSDPDGDALSLATVNPTNGIASIAGTNVVFTPATNFIGTATIGYSIADGAGGTSSALITISITNRPPLAVNDSGSTPKNVAMTIAALANDSDPDNDPLVLVSVSPTNGVASIAGTKSCSLPPPTSPAQPRSVIPSPTASGGTNVALITISVTNRPPLAVNDSAATPKNISVSIPALSNDTDPDNDALSLVSVSPTNGLASIVGTNVVFTPPPISQAPPRSVTRSRTVSAARTAR